MNSHLFRVRQRIVLLASLCFLTVPVLAGHRLTGLADNGVTTRTVEWSTPQTNAAIPITIDPSGSQSDLVTSDQTQTMSDSWHWHNGITHTVTTVRRDNEGVREWIKRHKEAVDLALEYFPPDHT